VLATYVEERVPFEPGALVSHVVRIRGERMDHSFSPRRIRLVNVPRLAVNLLRTAERLLVEEGAPTPLLAAARSLGVDLQGDAWVLAVRARTSAGGARDERQLQRAALLIESGQLSAPPEAPVDSLPSSDD